MTGVGASRLQATSENKVAAAETGRILSIIR
jgi:hypothetical protein